MQSIEHNVGIGKIFTACILQKLQHTSAVSAVQKRYLLALTYILYSTSVLAKLHQK